VKTSETTSELWKALKGVQNEIKNPINNTVNPFYNSKYVPLNDILNDYRPRLTKHGLFIIQEISGDTLQVTTRFVHDSGEWLEVGPLTVPLDKTTAQGMGSAATYGRRYQLSALLAIASENDDDGNGAEGSGPPKGSKATTTGKPVQPPPAAAPPPDPNSKITPEQIKKLHALGTERGYSHEDLSNFCKSTQGVDSMANLTYGQASEVYKSLKSTTPIK
jgi:hypothetical protein